MKEGPDVVESCNHNLRIEIVSQRAPARDADIKFKNVRVKLGDNQIIETEPEVVSIEIDVFGLSEVYECVAVIHATPGEFDRILGIPFLKDMQSYIGWRDRLIEETSSKNLCWERASEICGLSAD
ncbi:Hypothetical protein PHPALM_8205 [Phytophthora palmivora]|uniref:Uncharacterized protein n=1 Tax=Phytophthora palmivora TaxID=4796 RepID=A0A2P4YAF1_9STRA|nr:Hypothetical protein PHPALM_8205 [Phytophthora palmivora]